LDESAKNFQGANDRSDFGRICNYETKSEQGEAFFTPNSHTTSTLCMQIEQQRHDFEFKDFLEGPLGRSLIQFP
jgi:hypothetical protein